MNTIVEILGTRSRMHPGHAAFVFLDRHGTERERLNWAGLDAGARGVAALLQARGIAGGERVLLLFRPGLGFVEAFFGCLYAGAIAVPVAHVPSRRVAPHVDRIAADCAAAAVLTDGRLPRGRFDSIESPLASLPWLTLAESRGQAADATLPDIDPERAAFLQYTSGSVQDPKGVVISHRNLLTNEAMIAETFATSPDDLVLGWLPMYHDMGLIGNLLQPVYIGCRCVLMSPYDFVHDPFQWLSAISRYEATISGGPNFAYDLCVTRITDDERASVDLRSWRIAFNGAEPVRADTLDRFSERFAASGFRREALYPCYGLAEATLFVTAGEPGRTARRAAFDMRPTADHRAVPAPSPQSEKTIVSCGRPHPALEVALVDPETRRTAAPDRIGEIWIAGESVAHGYWNRPVETARHFGARRADADGGPYYRTGDLGFIRDGELYVTGRLSDLIVVRGRNHYAHEIERTAEDAHPGLRRNGAAAFVADDAADPQLAIVLEVERGATVDRDEAALAVRQAVFARHDVAVHDVAFVAQGAIPRTTSGKVRRQACRAAWLAGRLPLVADHVPRRPAAEAVSPADPMLAAVTAAVAELLRMPEERIDADASLLSLGIDSLMALRIQEQLETRRSIRVSTRDMLSGATVRAIAAGAITTAVPRGAGPRSPRAVLAGREPDLSHGQRALWFLAQLAPAGAAYHVSRALTLSGPLDVEALCEAIRRLTAAHTALRTTFPSRAGSPLPQVHDALPPTFFEVPAEHLEDARLRSMMAGDVARPFELASGPLVRAHVYRRSATEHVVLVVAHHLVVDLLSMELMWQELRDHYADVVGAGAEADGAASDYRAFVRWQAAYLESAEAERDLAFWKGALAGTGEPLNLPADRPRPAVKTYRGAAVPIAFDGSLTDRLKRLADASGCTLYTVILSLFAIVLSRTSGQDEIVIGSPATGRAHADLRRLVGFCANMLPIVARLDAATPFRSFLAAMQQAVLDCLEHQHYPFPLLVDRLHVPRRADRSPLFDAAFVWHGGRGTGFQRGGAELPPGGAEVQRRGAGLQPCEYPAVGAEPQVMGNLTVTAAEVPTVAAQFDVALALGDHGGRIEGCLEFNTDLFEPSTAARLADRIREVAGVIAGGADTPIGRLRVISDDERADLLALSRGPSVAYPAGQTLATLIERQADLPGDRIALGGALGGPLAGEPLTNDLTYARLHDLAGRLADRLRHAHGVRPNDVVALLMNRSAALVVGITGILRAGAAFLPLNGDDPPERLAHVLNDCGCRVVLTTGPLPPEVPFPGAVLDLTDAAAFPTGAVGERSPASPDDIAYVIYTSGSTGRPKGVMIDHRAAVNRLLWMADALAITENDVILQKTPATFDVAVWELLLPLTRGARMVLLPPRAEREPAALLGAFARHHVTTAHFVPSMLSAFVEHLTAGADVGAWRRCICSGEALPAALCERFLAATGDRIALYNLYGPTEAAIDVTWHRVSRGEEAVPIGRPVANTTIHLLDEAGGLVPRGTPGEICIGGVQVGRGYMGEYGRGARGFCDDPFAPGGRMYRTGDRGRWRPDGSLEYLGRLDNQLKVRGWRVEPEEVEAALVDHPDVAAAVVVGRGTADGTTALVAYVVPRHRTPTARELMASLRQRLPDGLVPTSYVFLAALPLTTAGKVDRRRLPDPPERTSTPSETPMTPAEATLARIWSEELGVGVGADDSFFDLGGDSIRSVRVVARALQAGLSITVEEILRYQTVRDVLAHAGGPPRAHAAPSRPFELIPAAWRSRLADDVEDAYPLSMVQRSLVFLAETSPRYEVYVTTVHARVGFDEAALKLSLAGLVARHAFLRVSFDLARFAEPIQCVHANVTPELAVVDWRDRTPVEQERRLAAWLQSERRKPFDWTRAPMLRCTVHRRSEEALQFTLSDPSLDGWCVASLISELFDDYLARLNGLTPPALAVPPIEYRDFVAAERAALSSPDHDAFWQSVASSATAGLLPRWPAERPAPRSSGQQRLTVMFDADVCERLGAVGREAGVPLKSLLLAAHIRAVALAVGTTRVTTGLELHGRPEEAGGDRVVGVFNNILPLAISLAGGTWRELARQAYRLECDMQPHRRYPGVALRTHGSPPLFETMFVFTHFHVYERLVGRDDFEVLDAYGSDQTFLPLTAHFHKDVASNRIALMVDFDPSEIDRRQADAFLRACERAVLEIAAHSDRRYDLAPLLDPDEYDAALSAGAGERTAIDERALEALVGVPAADRGDRIAVTDGGHHLTYAAMHVAAERVARHLARGGIGPEDRVGVCIGRSRDALVAMLGVLKAGAAYVPLDPSHPARRLEEIVVNSGARVVLASGTATPFGAACAVLPIEELVAGRVADLRSATAAVAASPANAAYVIYTSGSTGRPKGVVVERRALANYLRWCVGAYRMVEGRGVPMQSSLTFDLTVTSALAPLVAGTTVHVVREADVDRFADLLRPGSDFTLLKITPSHIEALSRAGVAFPPSTVRAVVSGGEPVTPSSLRALAGANVFNEYGPTEATVGCCVHQFTPERASSGPVPIGRPIANTRVRVAGPWFGPAAVCVEGELLVAGAGLARGYLDDPAATAERFVPDASGAMPGERAYRTGDLARRLPDGNLEYLGRIDEQIKLRGYRIEPGEIEAHLLQHRAVREAVVVARKGAAAATRLIAYVVPTGSEPDPDGLRAFLRDRLPEYLIPTVFVSLRALPLSANGKLDRRRLPDPAEASQAVVTTILDTIDSLSDDEVAAALATVASVGE